MGTPLNIILVGFMGAGKTTSGKELAHVLGFQFLDLDQLIEEHCGMKIPDIFEKMGEDHFRKKEIEAVDSLISKKNYVVSTGGGVWSNPENRKKLLNLGLCVWLKVSPEKAFKRIEPYLSHRPLLASSSDPLKTITGFLIERETDYSKAHLTVNTDDKNPKQTALEIVEYLKKDQSFDLRSMQK